MKKVELSVASRVISCPAKDYLQNSFRLLSSIDEMANFPVSAPVP